MLSRRLLVVLLLTASYLGAQETINNASISGRVTDPSGAAVSGASVEARNLETNVSTTSTTDNEGRFRFPYLQIGNYEVRVTQTGFAAAPRKVNLNVGAAFQLPIALHVASAQETVEVSSEPAVVETARTQIAGTIE